MTKNKTELLGIWNSVWYIPGWLRILEMSEDYDEEDLRILERIDSNAIYCEKEMGEFYRQIERPKIQKVFKEAKSKIDSIFLNTRRLAYLNPEILALEEQIESIWERSMESLSRGIPQWLREITLEVSELEKKKKKLGRLRVEKHLILNPEAIRQNWVSPEEIARAMDFPFDQLIVFNKAGFAFCPFHKEKTPSFSFSKKTNKAHCFGCQWSGSPIDFLRKRDELTFQEAVQILCK